MTTELEQTKLALIQDNFVSRYHYSLTDYEEDYESELDRHNPDQYDYPASGARLSAAIKRLKTSAMLEYLLWQVLPNYPELETTPTVIKKLCQLLFERKGTQKIIVDLFGEHSRTARASQESHDLIEVIASQYFEGANKMMAALMNSADSIKLEYSIRLRKQIHEHKKKNADQ